MLIKFNNDKLRGKIYEKYGSIAKFSKKAGIHPTCISLALSGRRKMSREDILQFADALEINGSDFYDIFFNQMSWIKIIIRKSQQKGGIWKN